MIVSAATAAATLNFKIIYYTNILECEVRFKKKARAYIISGKPELLAKRVG